MPQFDSGAAEPIGRSSEGLLLRLLHPKGKGGAGGLTHSAKLGSMISVAE
jgi:hypothetical protein